MRSKLYFILRQPLFRMLPVVDISVIPYHPRMHLCGLSSPNLLTCVSVSNGFPSVTGKAESCHNENLGSCSRGNKDACMTGFLRTAGADPGRPGLHPLSRPAAHRRS